MENISTAQIEVSAQAIHRIRRTSVPFERLNDARKNHFRNEAAMIWGAVDETGVPTDENIEAGAIAVGEDSAKIPWSDILETVRNHYRAKAEAALQAKTTV